MARIYEAMTKVAAIILAAGRGSRMGSNDKLLSPYQGRPLLAAIIDAAEASKAAQIILVTGYKSELLSPLVEGRNITQIDNPLFDEGMSSSIKAGLAALDDTMDGAMICLADMPLLTHLHLDALISAFDGNVCAPVFNDKRGNPVLWGRKHFAALQALAGDKGARDILKTMENEITLVKMDDDATLVDVDTPEALKALVEKANSGE